MREEGLAPGPLPAGTADLLGPYLVRQRWYAGDKSAPPVVEEVSEVAASAEEG